MAIPKIIVTGSNGQLGSELKELAGAYAQYEFHFFSREDFPINDVDVAGRLFNQLQPSFLINCAAYTAVDKAETEKEFAMEINASAPGKLAALCKEFGTKFIHISTDYVFDGEATTPLKEDDPVAPVNYYGGTKLKGEQLVQQYNDDAIIIRTAWVYSTFGKNFVRTMIRLMGEKESIGVVNDQLGSPTYAADLAEAIMKIIDSGKWQQGIYHYSNKGVISWFDFATTIRDMIHSSCTVRPITTEQFPTPAKRPKYSVLDQSKIERMYSLQLKDWKSSLKVCLEKMGATQKKFTESDNTAVFTTKFVIIDNKEITEVHHDEDDGAWQFFSDDKFDDFAKVAKVVSLGQITKIDSTLFEIADMPTGYVAHRRSKGDKWIIEKKN